MASDFYKLFQDVPPEGFAEIRNTQGSLAPFLKPKSDGLINVVDNFWWTLTPKEGRKETPHVRLEEYRLLGSALINSARYYATGLTGLASDLAGFAEQKQTDTTAKNPWLKEMPAYSGLCDWSNKSGFTYIFPYFGDTNNEVTSTWTSLDIADKIKNAASFIGAGGAVDAAFQIAQLGLEVNYPRVGVMDRPKLWESSTPRNLNIKFPLFNTRHHDDIQYNWELCFLLLYQNMFNKHSFVTAIPPVFYTAYIPGQYFTIAAYVSDLKIYNRGNMRMININGMWRNIPDVYEIDMTLTDMIMPSQNMMQALLTEDPIQVTTNTTRNDNTDIPGSTTTRSSESGAGRRTPVPR
jgi:hypothetical protein